MSSAQGLPLSQVGEESQAGEGRGSMGGEVRSDRRKRPGGERGKAVGGEISRERAGSCGGEERLGGERVA